MHIISECISQKRNNKSEEVIEDLYKQYISKREYEFAIATNSLIYCENNEKLEGYGFPDYLLSINGQLIVTEVTTAHDLDGSNAVDQFMKHEGAGIISGEYWAKLAQEFITNLHLVTLNMSDNFIYQ